MPVVESNKKYTFADYLTWPEEERWEILDGTPSMLTAPAWQHQAISIALSSQIYNFLLGKHCQVYVAPFDLRLPIYGEERDEDVTNVYQPDITVICDRSKLKGSGYTGIPSLVIEITSPSTSKVDKIIKFNNYEKACVPEYWIVEPEGKTVMVFKIQGDKRYGRPDIYSEEDRIQVSNFPDLVVDLKPVFEGI